MRKLICFVIILTISLFLFSIHNCAWGFTSSNQHIGPDAQAHIDNLYNNIGNSKYSIGIHINQSYDLMVSNYADLITNGMLPTTGHLPTFVYYDLRHDDDTDGDYTNIFNQAVTDWNRNVISGFNSMKASPFKKADINNDNPDVDQESGYDDIPAGYSLDDVYTHPGNGNINPANYGQPAQAYGCYRDALVEEGRFYRNLWNSGVAIIYHTYLRTEASGAWFWPMDDKDTNYPGTGDQNGPCDPCNPAIVADADGTPSSMYQAMIIYEHNFFEDSHWLGISSKSGTFNTFETVTIYTNSCGGSSEGTGIYNEDDGDEVYIQLLTGTVSSGSHICGDNSGADILISSVAQQGLPNIIFTIRTSHYMGDTYQDRNPDGGIGTQHRGSEYHLLNGLANYVDIVGVSHHGQQSLTGTDWENIDNDKSTIWQYIEENETDPVWELAPAQTYTYRSRSGCPWTIKVDGVTCVDGNACDEKSSIAEVEADADGAFFCDLTTGYLYLRTPDDNDPDTDDPIYAKYRHGIRVIWDIVSAAIGSANFIPMFGDVNNLDYEVRDDADKYLDIIDAGYSSTSMIFHWRGYWTCIDGDGAQTGCPPRFDTNYWPAASSFVNDSRIIHAENNTCLAPGQVTPNNNATGVDPTVSITFVDNSTTYCPRQLAGSKVKIYSDVNKNGLVYESSWDASSPHDVTIPAGVLEGNMEYWWTFIHGINVGGNMKDGQEQDTPYKFSTSPDIPIGGTTALLITGDNNTVLWSLVNGQNEESTGIKVSSGATGNKIYNITVVHCGLSGIDADEDVTVKNVLFRNNAGPDIDIATGKTVTAGNNSIQDAAKTGDGTYDSGTSDFSKPYPFYTYPFYYLSNYRLGAGVEERNGGVALYSGIWYDLVGRQVTDGSGNPLLGSAVDRGAFEFNKNAMTEFRKSFIFVY